MKLDFWNRKRKQKVQVLPWNQGFDPYPDTTRSSLFASGEEDWDVTRSTPVFQTRTDGQSRARSYEDFLRARSQTRPWDGPRSGGRFYESGGSEDADSMLRRGMQIIGALLLVGLLYLTFHSQQPLALKAQAFVRQSMSEDSDVSRMAGWWKQNVSDKVAPVISTGVSMGTDTKKVKFVLPVDGTVKQAFDGQDQQGITFRAALGADVHAAASGVIEKVDKEATDDYMVTISHGSAGKTVYRHLVTVAVKADEWVDPAQTIGTLTKTGDHAELFFAYQKDGAYVDPADVLPMPTGK